MVAPPNGPTWRLESLEERVRLLEVQNIAVLTERVSNLTTDLRDVRSTLRWLTRTIIGLAVTLIGGILVYALSAGGAG